MKPNNRYLDRITRWLPYARRYFYVPADRGDLLCYGTGWDGWGVQTNQKAFAAFAIAGALDSDERASDEALRLLRYSLETHKEGSFSCTDGRKWGHTWISGLGIERMIHGVEALRDRLTEADERLLRRVLLSESEWLLNNYEIVAGLESSSGRNKPESNLWNGSLLYRTALLYPDSPSAESFKEKAFDFFVSSLSVPGDEESELLYDGRRIGPQVKGANFFPSFALNHHGYLNVGYMVICLSQIAMLHLWCKERGFPAPEALYHHAEELWRLVKTLTFPDGRLNRIGGDTRARYCYCQDYLIPTLLLVADKYRDKDALALEQGWLTLLGREQDHNQSGGFISDRADRLREISQLYYTRLDADRACSLSMGAWWRPILSDGRCGPGRYPRYRSWSDNYHGSFFRESNGITCSFTWVAAEGPTAQFLPSDASDLAEWRHNLSPHIRGEGAIQTNRILRKDARLIDEGAIASGCYEIRESGYIAEGVDDTTVALVHLLFLLIPGSSTALVMHHAVSPFRTAVEELRGLFLQVPNDIWNSFSRSYAWQSGSRTLAGYGSKAEAVTVASNWIEVDERLRLERVYGPTTFTIYRPGRRQIGFKKTEGRAYTQTQGMLYCDEICGEIIDRKRFLDRGEVVVDSAYLMSAAPGAGEPVSPAASELDCGTACRAVAIDCEDGRRYAAVLPVEDSPTVTLSLDEALHGSVRDLVTGQTHELIDGRAELGTVTAGLIMEITGE